jgi:SAM-dependent methyltransferase
VHLQAVKQPPRPGRPAGGAGAGSRTVLTSELLCESVDLHAGERVLDVPCGGGSAALAAARRFCRAVGVDAPEPLERARRRAEADGLEVAFVEGGAGELPFPGGSFDVVLSAGDAMSALGPGAAAELLRVCRPGGRIGLVGWTPTGTSASWPPPSAGTSRHRRAARRRPSGAPRSGCASCSGPRVAITAPRRSFLWRFPSAEHQVAYFATFHDPTATALRALGPDRAGALEAELLELAGRFDVSEDETLVLRLDYLEAVVRKPVWL